METFRHDNERANIILSSEAPKPLEHVRWHVAVDKDRRLPPSTIVTLGLASHTDRRQLSDSCPIKEVDRILDASGVYLPLTGSWTIERLVGWMDAFFGPTGLREGPIKLALTLAAAWAASIAGQTQSE